jgi:hypothetical protein
VLLVLGLVLFAANWWLHGKHTGPLDATRLGKAAD